MCELFGVSSVNKINVTALLREFFSHGNEHPNGWGMAFFYNGSVSLEKEPENSVKSLYLKQRLEDCIVADNMMAHIRLATKGGMDYKNSHPFVVRDNYDRAWTFEHNGTVFECEALNRYVKIQRGNTDSERILLYITDRVNKEQEKKGRALDKKERFDLIDEVICEISPENKVNLLIYDGELLYAHTNFKDSLHVLEQEDTAIISTRPLDERNWKDLPMNTLCAYEDGKLLYTGTDHGHEFFETEEKMKLLFLDYAFL